MATKTLESRLKLKYDTLSSWSDDSVAGKGANLVLLEGEIAICYVPSVTSGTSTTAPTVLFKVGDGTKTFSALPWASGLAADVYDWAKSATCPVTDTDTQYQFVADGQNKVNLQSKSIGGSWADAGHSLELVQDSTDGHKIGFKIDGTAPSTWISIPDYTHPIHTRTDSTSTASPTNGGTFTAVDSITSNSEGHITAVNVKTVTLPTYGVATSSANGLMSKEDKAALDSLVDTVDSAVAATTASLDYTDTAEATKLVSAVSQSDGVISVTRRTLVAADIPTITKSKISDFSHDHNDTYYTESEMDTKLGEKLSLAGGTMSGTIKSATAPALSTSADSGVLTMCGGNGLNNGGRIDLNGMSDTTAPGRVSLLAKKTGAFSQVVLLPDGSFKKDGNDILDSTYIVDNLTTDNAAKPLSAKQGKALNEKFDSYRTSSAQDTIDATKASASDVTAIQAKIPEEASSSNQLADKAFVNSSIASNTANYISNNGEPFTSLTQLEAYSGTVTANDYAFVTGEDTAGNVYFDRYKSSVSGSTVTWAKEYRLNNSSFTAEQWSAITSGITAALVADIGLNTSARHTHDNKSVLDELSEDDLTKLDGISTAANKTESSATNGNIKIDGTETTVYTHPTYTTQSSGLYKVTVDDSGHVSATTAVTKSDITALGIPAQDTTYVFDGTYNASSNKVATVSTVTDAIGTLDSTVSATSADGNKYSVLTGVTEADGKLTAKTEIKLEAVAKTGNVNDLIQTSGDYLIFDCGSSTTVI